jgi:selenocysteine-specific elongation factor
VYHGSAQIEARFRLLGAAPIEPGERGVGQLVLATPELAAADDRMVLRRPSAAATVGGARVLDPSPVRLHRRHRAETAERFDLLLDGSPSARVLAAIAHRQPCAEVGLSPAVVGVEPGELQGVLGALVNAGEIAPLGGLWMTAAGRVGLDERAAAALRDHHARHPMLGGPPREEVRARLGLDRPAFQIWLDAAVATRLVTVEGNLIRLAQHRPEEEPGLQSQTGALLARFRAAPYDPPSIQDVRAGGEADALRALLERGELIQLTSSLALDAAAYERAKMEVIRILGARGQVTVVDVRDLLSTSRRVTLAILEQMDRERLTVRTGDVRIPGGGLRRTPQST